MKVKVKQDISWIIQVVHTKRELPRLARLAYFVVKLYTQNFTTFRKDINTVIKLIRKKMYCVILCVEILFICLLASMCLEFVSAT